MTHAALSRSVGVCWTRNSVPASVQSGSGEALAPTLVTLYLSLLSLRQSRQQRRVRTCLFTEASPSTVTAALGVLSRRWAERGHPSLEPSGHPTIDDILTTGDAEPALLASGSGTATRLRAMLDGLRLMRFRNTTMADKTLSRLGRILNMARAPYDVTLFLDEDTTFCSPAAGFRGALADVLLASADGEALAFHGGADVRLVETWLWGGDGPERLKTAGMQIRWQEIVGACHRADPQCDGCAGSGWVGPRCAACIVGCEDRVNAGMPAADMLCRPFSRARMNMAYTDKSGVAHPQEAETRLGLNGGAVLVRRGAGAVRFSSDWAQLYASLWSAEWEAGRAAEHGDGWGKDMVPLARIVTQRCVEMQAVADGGGGAAALARKWTVAPLFAGLNVRPSASIRPIKLVLHSHDVNLAAPVQRRFHGASKVEHFCRAEPQINATQKVKLRSCGPLCPRQNRSRNARRVH
jgi:hypothetical protein